MEEKEGEEEEDSQLSMGNIKNNYAQEQTPEKKEISNIE